MSGNSGAWGVAMWKDGHAEFLAQEAGISLEGGDPVLPFLPTDPVGSLLVPPEGLGTPAIRSGDVAYAQRDGVVQFADYYEARQITLQVRVKNDDCPGCSTAPAVDAALVLDGVSPGRATTPDAPALDITGDLDVVVHLALDDWTPAGSAAPVSKWVTSPTQDRAWTVRVNTTGTLGLFWSPDGIASLSATSNAIPVVPDGGDLWLRFKLDVDNGAGGRDIRFEISTNGVTWDQLGSTITQAGVTSIYNSTAPIAVGSYNNGGSERMAGRVFEVQVRNGIDGPLVAHPVFDQPAGTTSFVDSQGVPWTVVAPARLQPYVAAVMSSRQKVSRLTEEWSRNCSGATLVLFTDCHDPNATEAEKVYLGPYMVHGRPRVADVLWDRSNRGMALVTLRFDAADARLVLADTIPGSLWTSEHVQTIDANEQNLAQDADLSTSVMTTNGGTMVDSRPQSGGPLGGNGGPYFSRLVQVPNTTTPMSMATTGTGTAGIPVTAGLAYRVSWWIQKTLGGGPAARADVRWYTAAGVAIGAVASGAAFPGTPTWERVTSAFTAPATAAFMRVDLAWTGTGLVDQVLNFAQLWINQGPAATSPETVEIEGTLCAYPVISLFPGLTAPIVVTYGGHEFTYTENVTSVIEIDTRWGRASDGSLDVTANIEGDFMSPLEPGVHEVTMQSGSVADSGFVNVVWENAVVSG